jgi:hypothetical protein
MLFLLTTWVTQRMVGLVVFVGISVSTLPTTLILVANHESEGAIRAQLVQQVRAEVEAAVLRINTSEQACDGQIQQLSAVNTARPAAVVQQLIAAGKGQHRKASIQFIEQLWAEESRVRELKDLDDDDVQAALGRVQVIITTAVGPNGALLVTCQTILVEIRALIEVVVTQVPVPAPRPARRHSEDGDDD